MAAARIVLFFVLTYAMSWTAFAAAAALGDRTAAQPFGELAGVVLLVGAFAPAVVAIVLTMWSDGREGVVALLRQITTPPVAARWYLFALFYFVGVKLTVAVLHRIVAGAWPAFGAEPWYVMAVATVFSTPVQAGEELGWRAFALPQLSKFPGLGGASVVIGVIWACWHLPFFSMPGTDKAGQSFPVYLLDVTAFSVALAWLYWRTNGRLLLTMLMHAAANNTKDIVPSAVAGATDRFALSTSLTSWLTAGVLWICAAGFLIHMRLNARRQRFPVSGAAPRT